MKEKKRGYSLKLLVHNFRELSVRAVRRFPVKIKSKSVQEPNYWESQLADLMQRQQYALVLKRLFSWRFQMPPSEFVALGKKTIRTLKDLKPQELQNGGLANEDLERILNRLCLIEQEKI